MSFSLPAAQTQTVDHFEVTEIDIRPQDASPSILVRYLKGTVDAIGKFQATGAPEQVLVLRGADYQALAASLPQATSETLYASIRRILYTYLAPRV